MKVLAILILIHITLGSAKLCPGGKRQCPEKATCCELPDKQYGCCPMEDAVCCDDHIHCCPHGTRCSAGMCFQLYNENVTVVYGQSHSAVCPGGQYSCPEDSTCCKSPHSSIYNCCLLPNAVCCADGESCCPQSSACDLKNKTCIVKGYHSETYSVKKVRSRLNKKMNYSTVSVPQLNDLAFMQPDHVLCPGGQYVCPDGYTCCLLPSQKWGCCPFVNAVCCSDHLHCCPQYTMCDPTSEKCNSAKKNVTWSETVHAVELHAIEN